MENGKILIFIGSIIAIVVGWILNEFSYWFRIRREDKKKLKKVLYNLLETFHLLLSSNIESYVEILSQKMVKTLPEENQSEETKQFLNQIYLNFMQEYLNPIIFDRLNKIKDNYKSSINSLAQIDPILAYMISDKTAIIDYFNKVEKWNSDFYKKFSEEGIEEQRKNKFALDQIKSDLTSEEIKELRRDILIISWKIAPITYYKSRRITNNTIQGKLEAAEKRIDEWLDNYLKTTEANLLSKVSKRNYNMYYFAYGSNMNHEQMKFRCSDSCFLQRVFLKDYKFVYDGWSNKRKGAVANIIETKKESDIVWGGLFEITTDCRKKLDKHEGYKKTYDRKVVEVEDDSKNSYAAIAYFRTGEKPGEPHEDYRKIVVEGAKDCNLPEDYIKDNLK